MTAQPSLDQLEAQVLARIAGHRRAQRGNSRELSVGIFIALSALALGLVMGRAQLRVAQAQGSESAVLAEDARLAPSTLLASSQ